MLLQTDPHHTEYVIYAWATNCSSRCLSLLSWPMTCMFSCDWSPDLIVNHQSRWRRKWYDWGSLISPNSGDPRNHMVFYHVHIYICFLYVQLCVCCRIVWNIDLLKHCWLCPTFYILLRKHFTLSDRTMKHSCNFENQHLLHRYLQPVSLNLHHLAKMWIWTWTPGIQLYVWCFVHMTLFVICPPSVRTALCLEGQLCHLSLPFLCLSRATLLWQMYADFCSCALTCWVRVNETWDVTIWLAKIKGGLFRGQRQ